MPTIGSRTGTLLGGVFRLGRLLGAGGVGEVYEATHTESSQRFAIKVITACTAGHEDYFERCLEDAWRASELRHPHIPSLFAFEPATSRTPAFLATTLLEGMPLERMLDREGPLALDLTVELAAQTLSALAAAHRAGLVHGDLKPSNILVTKDERVLVLDFGMRHLVELVTRPRFTGPAPVPDTNPAYLAPEQAMRGSRIDGRTDLYSWAALMYRVVSGQPPFRAATRGAMLHQIMARQPARLSRGDSRCGPELAALIDACLAKDPAARPADAETLLAALYPVLASASLDSNAGPPPPPHVSRLERARARAAAGHSPASAPAKTAKVSERGLPPPSAVPPVRAASASDVESRRVPEAPSRPAPPPRGAIAAAPTPPPPAARPTASTPPPPAAPLPELSSSPPPPAAPRASAPLALGQPDHRPLTEVLEPGRIPRPSPAGPPPTPRAASPSRPRRGWRRLLGVGAGLVALACVLGFAFASGGADPAPRGTAPSAAPALGVTGVKCTPVAGRAGRAHLRRCSSVKSQGYSPSSRLASAPTALRPARSALNTSHLEAQASEPAPLNRAAVSLDGAPAAAPKRIAHSRSRRRARSKRRRARRRARRRRTFRRRVASRPSVPARRAALSVLATHKLYRASWIHRRLRPHRRRIDRCYAAGKVTGLESGLAGWRLHLSSKGDVRRVQPLGATRGRARLHRCVATVLGRISWGRTSTRRSGSVELYFSPRVLASR